MPATLSFGRHRAAKWCRQCSQARLPAGLAAATIVHYACYLTLCWLLGHVWREGQVEVGESLQQMGREAGEEWGRCRAGQVQTTLLAMQPLAIINACPESAPVFQQHTNRSHLVQVQAALLACGCGAVDANHRHLLHCRPSQLRPAGIHARQRGRHVVLQADDAHDKLVSSRRRGGGSMAGRHGGGERRRSGGGGGSRRTHSDGRTLHGAPNMVPQPLITPSRPLRSAWRASCALGAALPSKGSQRVLSC